MRSVRIYNRREEFGKAARRGIVTRTAMRGMKGNSTTLNLLLALAMMGVLALTTPAYITCSDDLPDEFLELRLVLPCTVLPTLASALMLHSLSHSLTELEVFMRMALFPIVLRC